MGAYATTTSISTFLPNALKGNTTTTDIEGMNVFSQFITDAEAEINAALATRYAMPFTTVPPLLRKLAGDIAAYRYIRAGFAVDTRLSSSLDEFKMSFDILDKIVAGKRNLTLTDGSLVPTNSNKRILSSTEGYTQIFGRDRPKSWARDPDEIDDTADARE